MAAIPRHVRGQIEHLVPGVEYFAPPMVFQDAPHPFNRVVFAVVRRIIGQLQVDIVPSGKLDQSLDQLGPMALGFRPVIHVQDERVWPKPSPPFRPQVVQSVHNKIGGHRAFGEKEPDIVGRRQQETKQLQLRVRGEIMIAGRDAAAIAAPTGIRTKPNRRLGVQ